MDLSVVYYSQNDVVKELARELEIPIYQAKEMVVTFFEIVLDRLSDADKVEIRLYNGLNIVSRFEPSENLNLSNIKTDKDKMVRLSLKPSVKLKNLLYGMNKDKELEKVADSSEY